MKPTKFQWILATCMLNSWVGLALADEAEDRAIAALKKLRASVTQDNDKPGKPAVAIPQIFNPEFGDADLVHCKDLKNLEQLNLEFKTKITNAGLVHIQDLKKLKNLNLMETQVSDEGLPKLKALKQLQSLSLGSTNVSDAGLLYLKEFVTVQTTV